MAQTVHQRTCSNLQRQGEELKRRAQELLDQRSVPGKSTYARLHEYVSQIVNELIQDTQQTLQCTTVTTPPPPSKFTITPVSSKAAAVNEPHACEISPSSPSHSDSSGEEVVEEIQKNLQTLKLPTQNGAHTPKYRTLYTMGAKNTNVMVTQNRLPYIALGHPQTHRGMCQTCATAATALERSSIQVKKNLITAVVRTPTSTCAGVHDTVYQQNILSTLLLAYVVPEPVYAPCYHTQEFLQVQLLQGVQSPV
uniref:Thermosome subunit beta n=1 Tax=Lygus hesperus TaxID=30085 RepID=A0A0A9VY16_LYGHE